MKKMMSMSVNMKLPAKQIALTLKKCLIKKPIFCSNNCYPFQKKCGYQVQRDNDKNIGMAQDKPSSVILKSTQGRLCQTFISDVYVISRPFSFTTIDRYRTKVNFDVKTINSSDKGRRRMANILQCDIQFLDTLLKEFPSLRMNEVSAETIEEKVNIILSFGVPIELLHKFPRMLTQSSAAEIRRRLTLFEERGFINDLLGDQVLAKENHFGYYMECNSNLFKCAWRDLCQDQDALEGHKNQFEYLKFRLNTSDDVTAKLMQNTYLRRGMAQSRLKKYLDFFLVEVEISPDFLIKFISIIGYSLQRTRIRFLVLTKANGSETLDLSHASLYYLLKLPHKQFTEKHIDIIDELSQSNQEVKLYFKR